MPELLPTTFSAQLRRMALLLVGAWSLLPACALAQSVPASLRACAAESDSTRRLACYDREMARLSRPPARPAIEPTRTPSAPHRVSSLRKILGGDAAWHVTAHIAHLDRWPDAMVLHLDNGQVWQQTGRASGDLSLHVGDSVTIEKHLGSYWLTSRYVTDMQVRLKPQ
jgi:hypothetical protein